MNLIKIVFAFFLINTIAPASDTMVFGQSSEMLTSAQIEEIMRKVNQYQLSNPWTDKEDYNWIRGTFYTGAMAAYQATGDEQYLKQCNDWGRQYKWSIPAIKQGAGASGANVLTCSQTWLESYFVKEDKDKIKPLIAHLEASQTKNPVNQPLDWYYEGGRRYVDALYVGPPALLMLYKATKQEKYLQWMESFFWDVYGKLYDREDSLFYRDKRYIRGYSETNERDIRPDSIKRDDARRSYIYSSSPRGNKVFWSRGNGWAFAGIARILKYLPEDHVSYPRYLALYKQMAYTLKNRQRENGFWPINLDDPSDYPYPEASGTAFFTYGFTMGINSGWLPAADFKPVVRKSWKALHISVNSVGKVQWGQPVGSAPYRIYLEDSHEYVSGMFLLAASEIYKMVKN